MTAEKRRVFLTGASTGIGAALALRWAREGVHLGLVARSVAGLESLAATLRARGATVQTFPLDVADTAAMSVAAADFLDAAGGVDLVVANAGVGTSAEVARGEPVAVARLISTNLIGATNTLLPFLPAMRAASGGVLVGIGSVAGFRALPGRAAYSASKAGLKTFLDGLRLDLRGSGVHAMTICPGFVRSPMTDRLPGKLPFLVSAEDAAGRIDAAIGRRDTTFTFPAQMAILSSLWCQLPEGALARLLPAGPQAVQE